MPFDGNLKQFSATEIVAEPKATINDLLAQLLLPVFFLICIVLGLVSEVIWPQSGILTRLVEGDAVADQNYIVHRIVAAGVHRLKFTVAEHEYQVITPIHPLTDIEKAAWLGFASRYHNPMYSADGPLAMDP